MRLASSLVAVLCLSFLAPPHLDVRAEEGHVGLRSLAGLAADLGGALEVSSAPGTGTRVQLSVPTSDRMHR